ncbi:glutamate-rich protein 3-like isoform X1 [Athene cunicularia]|uniref:glutamate-rich protein 3-like isoform X1 n=1 Tax=Athene cunicularia TaxID=194338 RepID=UPI000EF756A5|nr:glutamate-rich protein 3-like isoform X1 [Athene cunicularia]
MHLYCFYFRLLKTYNSPKDKHLTKYINNTWIRQHHQRSGLISSCGRIITEKECQLNTIQEEHPRYTRECLAGTVFHKALGIEAGPSRRPVGNASFMYSPHPPPSPRNHRGLFPPLGREATGRSQQQTSRQPHIAPGDLQHSLHFPPLPICAAVGAVNTSTSEKKCLAPQLSLQPASREERSEVKHPNVAKYMTSISPSLTLV